ncbi:MAG: hypothetical protein M1832_002099 [Thelocarpon impressellum]|nr:MAG: hypothetical protein M1832_002099 [Thelocarpon impressellum]
MNPVASQTSATASRSGMRPRNRRVGSVADGEQGSLLGSPLVSPLNSARPSRAVSPIPSKHPSRPTNASQAVGRRPVSSGGGGGRPLGGSSHGGADHLSQSAGFGSGLWGSSWSTLQGLASTVLGGESGEERRKDDGSAGPQKRRQRLQPGHRKAASSGAPLQWGPAPVPERVEDRIGGGPRESREAQVRARRREELLRGNGHVFADASGQYKRRTSDDRGASSAPPGEHDHTADRDAMVYVHRVRPQDTLAGVIIQFNCQPVAFRRANRLWPHDTIQSRKTVVLPVEACGVKGRPLPEQADEDDLLGSDVEPFDDVSRGKAAQSSNLEGYRTSPSTTSQEHHDDPPWQHDSWVEIEGHPGRVEIARLPRRTLGFFPPSRRKSVSFSDLDTPSASASASFDLPRLSDGTPPPRTLSRSDSASASHFAQRLHGPGGVGTLGAGVTGPGPGPDKLNRYLAPHLPSVAPRESFESTSSGGGGGGASTGLEHVGSAIEGWVRKLATRAATAMDAPGTAHSSRGGGGLGDLIELSDGLEGGSDDGRVREGPSSGREVVEAALRERYPVRGRGTTGEGARSKKGD